MNKLRFLFTVFLCFLILSCQNRSTPKFAYTDLAGADWRRIETLARGTSVNFAMWAGDENRNRFFQTYAADELKKKYNIDLNIIPLGDTAEAISKLLNEKSAGKNDGGSIDIIWINGENFRTAK
ncbi:MAG: ABC transporter substrate-binding protein, partial [Pyrinomonadaceae bacterium]